MVRVIHSRGAGAGGPGRLLLIDVWSGLITTGGWGGALSALTCGESGRLSRIISQEREEREKGTHVGAVLLRVDPQLHLLPARRPAREVVNSAGGQHKGSS